MHDLDDLTMHIYADSSGGGLVTTDSCATAHKVTGVRISLEADQVGAEHAVEDLFPLREASEDLA